MEKQLRKLSVNQVLRVGSTTPCLLWRWVVAMPEQPIHFVACEWQTHENKQGLGTQKTGLICKYHCKFLQRRPQKLSSLPMSNAPEIMQGSLTATKKKEIQNWNKLNKHLRILKSNIAAILDFWNSFIVPEWKQKIGMRKVTPRWQNRKREMEVVINQPLNAFKITLNVGMNV